MPTTDPSGSLQLLDTSADTTPDATATAATKETTMNTSTYAVTGMTCGHCEHAVTSELETLDGVTDVAVDLVPGGTSSVTVTKHPAAGRDPGGRRPR
jgi:copper chaperone CopZ